VATIEEASPDAAGLRAYVQDKLGRDDVKIETECDASFRGKPSRTFSASVGACSRTARAWRRSSLPKSPVTGDFFSPFFGLPIAA
jgi:hypothetical protein